MESLDFLELRKVKLSLMLGLTTQRTTYKSDSVGVFHMGRDWLNGSEMKETTQRENEFWWHHLRSWFWTFLEKITLLCPCILKLCKSPIFSPRSLLVCFLSLWVIYNCSNFPLWKIWAQVRVLWDKNGEGCPVWTKIYKKVYNMRVSWLRKVYSTDKVREDRQKKKKKKKKNLDLRPKFGNKSRKELLARLKCGGEADSLKIKPFIVCLSSYGCWGSSSEIHQWGKCSE